MATVTAALCAPASAAADTLYTSPTGSGTACTRTSPCDLEDAVNTLADAGDEVVLRPGTYDVGGDSPVATKALNIHGQAGAARPLITGNGFGVFGLAHPGATLSDVRLQNDNGSALGLEAGTADRLVAIATGSGGVGCVVSVAPSSNSASIENSACIATGENGRGINSDQAILGGGDNYVAAAVRNSTAMATGTNSVGIWFKCSSGFPGTSCEMNIRSSIAFGNADDLLADGDASTTVDIDIRSSNFDDPDFDGVSTITPPTTAGNQTALPQLEDPDAGNVRERPGSPTIDAGSASFLAGSLDLDRQARYQGRAPDIGADEFVSKRCLGAAPNIVARGGTARGTVGADVIVGTRARNVIRSRAGNDRVCALGGNDAVRAGKGRDRILGGTGRDGLFGGVGRDLLRGQAGIDLLVGGPGGDTCLGGPGLDTLRRC